MPAATAAFLGSGRRMRATDDTGAGDPGSYNGHEATLLLRAWANLR